MGKAFQSPAEYEVTLDRLVVEFREMFVNRPETLNAESKGDLHALRIYTLGATRAQVRVALTEAKSLE
jgi:hypothetical protein